MIAATTPRRALVRYYGGKWRLGPWIISHMPEHRTYVEPFGGGGSVLIRKPRCYAEVYNDLDGEVVNLFRVLREQGDKLREAVALTPFSRAELALAFSRCDEPLERARRALVRSHMGFGAEGFHFRSTGFRDCTTRAGTNPCHDWRNLPGAMGDLIERLRGVVIEQRPACDVIRKHDRPDTVHYVDPPYVHCTRNRSSYHSYSHEMTDDDHVQLAALLKGCSGSVLLSGYDCDLYRELYRDWRCVRKETHADGARKRTECLWLNFEEQQEVLPLPQTKQVIHGRPATDFGSRAFFWWPVGVDWGWGHGEATSPQGAGLKV